MHITHLELRHSSEASKILSLCIPHFIYLSSVDTELTLTIDFNSLDVLCVINGD